MKIKKMKIITLFALSTFVLFCILNIEKYEVISKGQMNADNKIYLDKSSIKAVEGEIYTLSAKKIIDKATKSKIKFSVDNHEVVKILELSELPEGIILKLLKPGTAVVCAEVNGESTYCRITVLPFEKTSSESKLNHYFGDLHSHTGFSDGKQTPEEAYKHAKQGMKADFLAITDHTSSISEKEWFDTIKAAETYNEDGRFLAIPLYEGHYHLKQDVEENRVIMNGNEAIGFNTLEKPYSINESDNSFSMIKQYDRAVGMFPHPGEASGDSNLIWNAYDEYRQISPIAREIMRLAEVRNETSAYNSLHEASYTLALDHGWYMSPTANSDNHNEGWTTSYNFRTVILSPSLTRQHLYEAIKDNRVYATEDNNLKLEFYVNNSIMGSKLSDKLNENFNIKVKVNEPDQYDSEAKISKLEIISDYGKTIYSKDLYGYDIEENISLRNKTARYFFVRVTKKDGKRAWSSPVWTGRDFDNISPRNEKAERLINSNWIISSVNIEGGSDIKAFDGKLNTQWQSTGNNAELLVDMGREESICAIGYIKHNIPLANETEANKLMSEYEYYISTDNKNWAKVSKGNIRAFGREHYEKFTPRVGRYIKIKALKPLKGDIIAGGEFFLYRLKK
jgi:hypothetical protein